MAGMDNAPTIDFTALAEADTLKLPGSEENLQGAGAQPVPLDQPEALDQPPQEARPEDQVDMKVAISNFARAHEVDPSKITSQDVTESKEGIYYWATKHLDTTARGPGAQSMNRALKHRPDLKSAYAILTDNLKQDFRRSWLATKTFDFTTTRRSTSNAFLKRKDEAGKFVTKLQLENILGGSDKQEACEQASNYITMCLKPSLKDPAARFPSYVT